MSVRLAQAPEAFCNVVVAGLKCVLAMCKASSGDAPLRQQLMDADAAAVACRSLDAARASSNAKGVLLAVEVLTALPRATEPSDLIPTLLKACTLTPADGQGFDELEEYIINKCIAELLLDHLVHNAPTLTKSQLANLLNVLAGAKFCHAVPHEFRRLQAQAEKLHAAKTATAKWVIMAAFAVPCVAAVGLIPMNIAVAAVYISAELSRRVPWRWRNAASPA